MIDHKEEIKKFLIEHFKKGKKYVIGFSGGIDSAVVMTLAIEAVGKDNVHIYYLPYGDLPSPESEYRVKKQINELTKKYGLLNFKTIDIEPIVDTFNWMGQDILPNTMARVRMMILYNYAYVLNGLVLGTTNFSEYVLGYFTKWGDASVDLEVILGLSKLEVKELAKDIGIIEEIIEAVPSAELWKNQSDEGELGFSYSDLEPLILEYRRYKELCLGNVTFKNWIFNFVPYIIPHIKEEYEKRGYQFNSESFSRIKGWVYKNSHKTESIPSYDF